MSWETSKVVGFFDIISKIISSQPRKPCQHLVYSLGFCKLNFCCFERVCLSNLQMLFLKWEVTQANLVPEKFYIMKRGVGSLHSFFSSFFSRHLIADTIIFRMTLFLTTCWNNNIRVNLLILFRMALSSTVKKSKTKTVAVPQGVHDGKTGVINSYKDGFWAYLSSVLEKYLEV